MEEERDIASIEFAQLLKTYRNMIYKIITTQTLNYGDFHIDEDDLFQEASLALLEAKRNYEEGKGMKFSSFAYMVIRRRVARKIRDYRSIYQFELYSCDNLAIPEKYRDSFVLHDEPVRYFHEQEFYSSVSVFLKGLSEEEKTILYYRNKGSSYKDIAEKLGKDAKYIDNRLFKIKKKLSTFLEEENPI